MYSKLDKEGKLHQLFWKPTVTITEKEPIYKTTFWGFKKFTGEYRIKEISKPIAKKLDDVNPHEYLQILLNNYSGNPYACGNWETKNVYFTPSGYVVNHYDMELFEDERIAYNFLRFNVFNIKRHSHYCYSFDEIKSMLSIKLNRTLEDCEDKDIVGLIYSVMCDSQYWNKDQYNHLNQDVVRIITYNKMRYYVYPASEANNEYAKLKEATIKEIKSNANGVYSLEDIQQLITTNEKICGIYKITNTITGLSYIGQAVNIYSRWKSHLAAKGNNKLYTAFRKYGLENFRFSIVEEVPAMFLDLKECDYIEKYNTYLNGYNSNGGPITKAKAIKEYLATTQMG